MPQGDNTKIGQDGDKTTNITSLEDTILEKSNIILLGPTGCGMSIL